MTSSEFQSLLSSRSEAQLLDVCLRDDIAPDAFGSETAAWNRFRDYLSAELAITRDQIGIVGSGRFGFSLKPENKFRAFSDTSDVDLIVVNAAIFDHVWISLLRAVYPRPPNYSTVGTWLQKRRNELYTGWIQPLDIRLDPTIFGAKAQPLLDVRVLWFNTLRRGSGLVTRRHEKITCRLYRTWQHAEEYHLSSLSALRRSLVSA